MNKIMPVLLMVTLVLSSGPKTALAQQQLTDPGVVRSKTDIARRLRDAKTNVTVMLRSNSALESLSALTILMERLSPKERAVLLLREVFDCDYDEIALVISKRADTCRQLLRRARQHLTDARARFEVSPEQVQILTRQFALTCASGDLKGLVTALAQL